MRRRRAVALLLTVLLLFLALPLSGCHGEAAPLPQNPRRVAVLFSSLAEMWQDAGGEVAITVGESVSRGIVAEGTPLVDGGAGKTVNVELLLSLSPDLVILSEDVPAQRDAAQILRSSGIPVLSCRVETLSDYLSLFQVMTDLTGNADAYQEKGEGVRLLAESVLAEERSPFTYVFIRAGATPSSVKPKTSAEHFAAGMLREMGGESLADGGAFAGDLSMETLLSLDPEYLFFVTMGDEEAAKENIRSLLAGEAWLALSAVREGRIFVLPKELFHYKPNAKWGEAYQALAELLREGDA